MAEFLNNRLTCLSLSLCATGSWDQSHPPGGKRSHSAWADFGYDPQPPSPLRPSPSSPLPSDWHREECERLSEGTWERGRQCTKRCSFPPPSSSFMWWAHPSSSLTMGNSSLNALPVFIMACHLISVVLSSYVVTSATDLHFSCHSDLFVLVTSLLDLTFSPLCECIQNSQMTFKHLGLYSLRTEALPFCPRRLGVYQHGGVCRLILSFSVDLHKDQNKPKGQVEPKRSKINF